MFSKKGKNPRKFVVGCYCDVKRLRLTLLFQIESRFNHIFLEIFLKKAEQQIKVRTDKQARLCDFPRYLTALKIDLFKEGSNQFHGVRCRLVSVVGNTCSRNCAAWLMTQSRGLCVTECLSLPLIGGWTSKV